MSAEAIDALRADRWNRTALGGGDLRTVDREVRFVLDGTAPRRYANAQIDDYQGLPRRRFPWRPPLTLTVRARFSAPAEELRGTAGFGFWNDPFLMTGARLPALPRAIWFFFASPPSNMKLDRATTGRGWKASTLDALRPSALMLAPLALPLVGLMNVRPIYERLWPPIQAALRVAEAPLAVDAAAWHTYELWWGAERAAFIVDGRPVLADAPAPRGPLGFVIWMDNQYLIATPWGQLGWGVLDVPRPQWLAVERLSIEPGCLDLSEEDEHGEDVARDRS